MLSYMVPSIEEKPPPSKALEDLELALNESNPSQPKEPELDMAPREPLGRPPPGQRRTIIKTHSKSSTLSADSSASSISSVLSEVPPTHQDKAAKPKINGNPKHPTLKRVSFGSSKGSMVETLIYESPLQEEPEPNDSSESGEKPNKVKVSFFESSRPVQVSSPEPCQPDEFTPLDAPLSNMTELARQNSTESGWDNPFRPDGDLSREADEIVELIKGGKPITPTSVSPPSPPVNNVPGSPEKQQASSPVKSDGQPPNGVTNGVTNGNAVPVATTEVVQRTTTSPPTAMQAEHVTLKKKPKSKCCIIQ